MFSFFRKKESSIAVTDRVFLSTPAKWKALLDLWLTEKNTAFVFWFPESRREAETFFAAHTSEAITLLDPREAATARLGGLIPVFAEHHPLLSREENLFAEMKLDRVTVYSALDEPLFRKFGADRIINLMKQLGMKEEEAIQHPLVTKSIRQAQEKTGKKIVMEQSAQSQADWFQKNFNR